MQLKVSYPFHDDNYTVIPVFEDVSKNINVHGYEIYFYEERSTPYDLP